MTKGLASSAEMATAGDALLTARQVAALFNVDRGWVYAHANELGVVRIGTGPRPRLRFDPAVLARLMLPARGRTVATPASYRAGADVKLLPIRPARPRSLGAQR